MTTTPNLSLQHIDSAQANPDTTLNASADGLDNALAGQLVHDMASDADYTLDTGSALEHLNMVIRITDTTTVLTVARNIIVPTNKKLYVFDNATAETLTIKTASGSGIAALAGEIITTYCDGVNVIAIAFINDDNFRFNMAFFIAGKPAASAEVLRIPMVDTMQFPVTMVGSEGKARVAANASAVFTFRKNGSSFATATFDAASSVVNTWVAASATTFAPTDFITVDAPASQDLNLEDIGFNLLGVRAFI